MYASLKNCILPKLLAKLIKTYSPNTRLRLRHYWRNMDAVELVPPQRVRGMRVLQRDAFEKRVPIPMLRVPEEQANNVLPLVKKLLLKMEHLRPVRALTERKEREILLHPLPVKSWESLPTNELAQHKISEANFYIEDYDLDYDNWRADEIFKSVLPEAEEGLTSYSRIGHIIHLNLREHLLPYKQLIGEVLLDKVPNCRTVVNKAATIDNTYRNFQFELICGVAEYQVETKEHGVTFEFDFSQVYWNPRLSTEHERIVKLLQSGDVLYDVFAGVGPFAVPAAKKRCHVLANDLNPESYRWLQHNAKRNKCAAQMQLHNKDGRDFILQEVKQDLMTRWRQPAEQTQKPNLHITMNLPALAVTFLEAFRGLFAQEADEFDFAAEDFNLPTVHVYAFAKGAHTESLVRALVEQQLGLPLGENLQGIHYVRNVAPNKDMYRVAFKLTKAILTTAKSEKCLKRTAPTECETTATPPAVCAKVKCS